MGYASQYRCPSNSIIIGRKGSINNPLFVETEFWNVDTAFGVVPNKEVLCPKFFFLFCKSFDFTRLDVSVTIPSLRRVDILQIPIPVPPLPVQEQIVSELDLLSGIIEKKREQLKELDALAQSIFYDMFGDPITNEKGWEVKKLGEVCEDKKNILRASKYCKLNDTIHYIDIASIDNQDNVIKNTNPYIYKDAPSRAQQIVIKGDILVSLVRPNLKNIAMVVHNEDNLIASSGFCVLRPNPHSDARFIKFLVLTKQFTKYLTDRVSGANYPAVREDDIKNCIIAIPPLHLQHQFATKIEAIEKQKELIKQSISETETLFNARMQEHFG